MKKKSTTKTNETFNTTQTGTMRPVNPEFVNTGIPALAGKIDTTFGAIDPKTFVAGPNDLMNQGAGALSQLGGGNASMTMGQNFLQDAGSAGAQSIDGVNIKDYIGDLMAMYGENVNDPALADFDQSAGMTRAQNKLALAGDQTFGGSSGALQTALGEGELARGRATTSANLRRGQFETALGGATAQAGLEAARRNANAGFAEQALGRRAGAGTALGQLGATQDANSRANAGAQFDMGEALRGITNAQTRAPLDLLLSQIGAFGGLPLDLLRGQDTTGTNAGTSSGTQRTTQSGATLSDWLNAAASAASAAAMASDATLKTDIETERYDPKGRRWVSWRWVWDEPDAERQYGVIAQEVQKTDPDAVMRHPMGFLMVDYSKLGDA